MPSTTTKKILAILLAGVTFLSAAPSADEKHISVYSPAAIYTLPVLDRAGHEYVGLLELLEPLGRVSSQTGRNGAGTFDITRWMPSLLAGKTRAKIRGRNFDFAAPVPD